MEQQEQASKTSIADWLRRNQAKLQFALRMTLAALASYALGEALGLSQAYWAVLSSVIVMQGSVGGSVRAGINRLIGTVGGALWGVGVAILVPHEDPRALALALFMAVAPLSITTAFRPDYRVAPITAIIVLMGATSQADPIASAISRVVEISLGSAVAIAVALFILPARAHRLLSSAGSATLSSMADLVEKLEVAPCHGIDAEGFTLLQNTIRIAISQTETRAAEAKVERSNRLSDGPDPEPLARTLRRLRHDLAMLVRALRSPFSESVRDRIEASLAALLDAVATWLRAAAAALAEGQPASELMPVQTALEAYATAVTDAGIGGRAYGAGKDDVQRVFALLFLFEQMLQNLKDLADRANELAGKGRGANKDGSI